MIDFYTAATPNGQKVAIALEELQLPYEVHALSFEQKQQKSPAFLKINPNGRIPAIIDRENDDFVVFESGAVLLYLAEKTGQLMPTDAKGRSQVIQWLMFQMGGTGPMFGQLGFFYKLGGAEIEDPRPRNRYINEARRLLGVVETALDGRDWIAGSYSVADMALAPWLRALDFYGAREVTGWHDHPNCVAYLERFLERPAVRTGLEIPPTA